MRQGLSVLGLAAAGALFAVAASGSGHAAAAAAPAASPATIAAGKVAYAACAACHRVTPGGIALGPTMFGVAGRKIASVPGFAYSPALKAKGAGSWTDAALDAYLAAPQKAVPGNRMPYPGQPDAAKRAALIAYLKTLK